ncbi:MAG: hypothetical protein KJ767_00455, partial [Nanoarchaeota archaeon]|nr:hypothetical protein [Nanoarchaeota archaeon]
PEHYKNLRHDLRDFKRVQIGHFVLVFRFDRKKELIYFADFDHHDNIYQKSSNHFFSLIEKEKNSS